MAEAGIIMRPPCGDPFSLMAQCLTSLSFSLYRVLSMNETNARASSDLLTPGWRPLSGSRGTSEEKRRLSWLTLLLLTLMSV